MVGLRGEGVICTNNKTTLSSFNPEFDTISKINTPESHKQLCRIFVLLISYYLNVYDTLGFKYLQTILVLGKTVIYSKGQYVFSEMNQTANALGLSDGSFLSQLLNSAIASVKADTVSQRQVWLCFNKTFIYQNRRRARFGPRAVVCQLLIQMDDS